MDSIPKNWIMSQRQRRKVERHIFKDEIENRLSYQSPAQVAVWLNNEGTPISERALRNYRNEILRPQQVLQSTIHTPYFFKVAKRLDALSELHNLIAVQIARLSIGLRQEQLDNRMLPIVERSLDLLRKTLTDVLQCEMDLGIRIRQKPGSGESTDDEQLKQLFRDILETADDEPYDAEFNS